MKSTQKVTNTTIELPTYYNKITNIFGKVTNTSYNTRFTLNFKSILYYELIKFLNPQIRAFSRKWSQLKKLLTLSLSYQHILIKVLTFWAKLPTYRVILDLL